MNKNILLINCLYNYNESRKWFIGAVHPEAVPLGYLASCLEKKGYFTKILSGGISDKEFIDEIEQLNPIAIGFSIYSFNYKRSLDLACLCKKKAQELGYTIFTIFGGYHVSCLPKEVASEKAVDFAIKGEGDYVIVKIIDELNNSKNFKQIPGLFYKEDGKIVETASAERIYDIDSIPLPKRELRFLKNTENDRNLSYPPASLKNNSAGIVYSRGCPFSCSFCCSKTIWNKKIIWRNPKLVVNEMETLFRRYNVTALGFLDLTFNANRQKVIDLCEEIIKRDIPVYWGCMARLDLFDAELLSIMAKAKCMKINLGLESPFSYVTTQIKDKYNAKEAEIKILNIIHEAGIIARAFLIIGFPDDTKESLEKYAEAVKYLPIDELRVTIATPFPGTDLWDQCLRKKLLPNPVPWEKFTTADPVLLHPNLKDEDIYYYREKLITSFFFSEYYEKRIIDKFKKFPHLRIAWKDYFEFFAKIGAFKKHQEQLKQLINVINNC